MVAETECSLENRSKIWQIHVDVSDQRNQLEYAGEDNIKIRLESVYCIVFGLASERTLWVSEKT